ncbi:MAG: hypothetical protein GEU92_14015 [Alphaproteobacteria bacterium]|nr:hypothetical protein [Alphaproteobacteria bacterium]
MLRNRALGVLSVTAGIVLNNLAYLIDIVRGVHNGFIYFGDNALLTAIAGVALILLGMFVLMRAGASSE